MADSLGNDVSAVGVPVTGFLGFAPAGTTFPTPTLGASTTLTLDPAFKKAGLLTEDGGFNWTTEADGDAITFWQDGYSIPSGLANVTVVAKLAQYDETVRGLVYGKTPDANGFITVDGGGTTNRYVLFTEEIFKNGVIRRRVAANVGIASIQLDQSTRGEVNGIEVTFSVSRSPLLNNEHFGEWLIPAPATAVATITTALPASQGAGQIVNLVGTDFTGMTAATVGGVAVPLFIVDGPTAARIALPVGSAGSAPITVTTPKGTSAPKAYTRVA